MNPSKDHNNWITIGEVINLIKKPVALYTNQIVQNWYVRLSKDCLPFGLCPNPANCKTKKKPADLCPSCNGWYKKLAKSHRNNKEGQIKWRENCDTSEWPVDPWEVAKYFMPILAGNKETTKDAESTDLSSLLNVLIWMKDVAFAPDRRVDLDLAKKLRSGVRNPWAHAPNQSLTDAEFDNAFDIANKFVADLDNVFTCNEVKKCMEDIKFVQINGISNVVEAELRVLNLLRVTDGRFQLKSCLPEKPTTIIGRDAEVNKVISSLVEDGCGIVSIVGGPGFGKSTVAREVSHHLNKKHDIVVIFSFLSNVSTVTEAILCLCRDVGVIPGADPKSSLMFWLRDVAEEVVLVMDNIEQLLEEKVRFEFTELLVNLRKNSQQQLHILTTTRTSFSIPNQISENVQIRELDKKASVELLRTFCPNEQVEDRYLSDLANLCGFVPLALCVIGSRIPRLDDPAELVLWLREKPMKALPSTDKNLCVRKAIEFSFQMLSNEDKKALARLSVFNGSFQKKSAQDVIERDGLETQDCLEQLVARSLIQNSSDKRFVIHSLIRHFLLDHAQLQNEIKTAQGLMVKHFLKVCHLLTIDSYSKNGFTAARELLKKDGHNVEETLKICCQNEATNMNPNVIESLASSHIYKSSSRFFYNFCWDLLPLSALRNYHESCLKLAESRKQIAIQITFQCLVADQEGRKSAWKSTTYIEMMEAIKDAFEENNALLKENRYLYGYCYYFYARYYSNIPANEAYPDFQANDVAALSGNIDQSPLEKVDDTLVLIGIGYLNKTRATKAFHSDKEIYEEYMKRAESFYNQALSSAKELLGDHELTSICHKGLGDLYFTWRKNQDALTYYSDAIELRKKLKLDSNEPFVYLLKNYGSCLSFLRRFDESIRKLNEARDIADKLAEKHTPCRANVYYALARMYCAWKPDCQEAAKYANTAMEMQRLLDPRSVKTLKGIIETARENVQQ